MAKIKNVHELTDEELEDCIDGSTNLTMVRDILTKPGVVDSEGWVNPEKFADWFSGGLQDFIDSDRASEEWIEANEVNWNWGFDIGDNINSAISNNFKDTNDT